MKTKYIFKLLFTLVLTTSVVSCGYNEEVIEELSLDREFAPIDLTARVRNQTNVELNWVVDDNIDQYIVEFSADDPNFNTIFLTTQVKANQLPIQIRLEGETVYEIRVKGVSKRGLGDSSWVTVQATTLTEQIMLPSEAGDIQALQATLRWEPGLNVTHFILEPGAVRYDISSQEKADGVVTITGLNSETDYTATLYNNAKIRGISNFKTGIDIGDNTLVLPTDDLIQMITDAAPGDILILEQGDYRAQTGTITLDKSITIQGLRVDFKPQLSLSFEISDGAIDVNLIDLDLDGGSTINDLISFAGTGNYNSLIISGCNIHDFARSLISGNVTGSILQTLTIENTIVTNVLTNGGDFIDFRNSDVLNLNINTSTFNNCAPGRDFIRMDASGTSNGNSTSNITVENSTLYACSNSSSRRLFYVRFETNEIIARNLIIANTDSEGYADRAGIDENPELSNNNYFNASGFFNSAQYIYDNSGTYTELDPGFIDANNGDFTVTNQTLLDNQVGDPRWRL